MKFNASYATALRFIPHAASLFCLSKIVFSDICQNKTVTPTASETFCISNSTALSSPFKASETCEYSSGLFAIYAILTLLTILPLLESIQLKPLKRAQGPATELTPLMMNRLSINADLEDGLGSMLTAQIHLPKRMNQNLAPATAYLSGIIGFMLSLKLLHEAYEEHFNCFQEMRYIQLALFFCNLSFVANTIFDFSNLTKIIFDFSKYIAKRTNNFQVNCIKKPSEVSASQVEVKKVSVTTFEANSASSFNEPLEQHRVAADGNCFFHAIVYQLNQLNINSPNGQPYTHSTLRNFIQTQLEQNSKLTGPLTDKDLRDLHRLGGQVDNETVQAMSDLLNIGIKIVKQNGEALVISPGSEITRHETICLLSNGSRYDSLHC